VAASRRIRPVETSRSGFDARVEPAPPAVDLAELIDGECRSSGLTAAVDDLSMTLHRRLGPLLLRPDPVDGDMGRVSHLLRPRRAHPRRRPAQFTEPGTPSQPRHDRVHRHDAGRFGRKTVVSGGYGTVSQPTAASSPASSRFGAVTWRARSAPPAFFLTGRNRRRTRHQPRPGVPRRPVQVRLVPVHRRNRHGITPAVGPDGPSCSSTRTPSPSSRASLVRRGISFNATPRGRRSRWSQSRSATVSAGAGGQRLGSPGCVPRPQFALGSIELASSAGSPQGGLSGSRRN